MTIRRYGLLAFSLFALVASGTMANDTEAQKPSRNWEWLDKQAAVNEQVAQSLREQFQALFNGMSPEAINGYRHLTESVYLPADFDEDVFAVLSTSKDHPPFQDVAVPTDARQANFLRFGLSPRPDDASRPLQYVVTDDKRFVMNCFACHGGSVYGATYPGAPNNLYALETLTEQVRRTKLRLNKPMMHMDVGSVFMPLGTSVGTSNAVMFGVALMNYRDAELNVHPMRQPAAMTHHDMDAPPWWHFHRKGHIYIDGFAQKGHRGLMQFMLVKENGPKEFQSWEDDFREVYQFLSELRPPNYPLEIDSELATQGKAIFEAHCSTCHGKYGDEASYPEQLVPIDDIKTDSVRLQALSKEHRRAYGASWFADMGSQDTKLEVDGYVAPPLDGIWASPPYLHNGSVPTLWHLMHPEERPKVWRRTGLGMDVEKMGIRVESVEGVPPRTSSYDRRWYFDTRLRGKSNTGHDYPNLLTESEKAAVLEYLKTL